MKRPVALPTEMRRRVQRALRTRSFRAALRSNTGAIDLASIMVGVIVIGVIAGVIAATVSAVIPWSQNAAAKQGLDAVRTAEGVAYVQDSKFSDFAGLVSATRIQASTTVNVATDTGGTCYVAVAKSAAGPAYYSTDKSPVSLPVSGTTSPGCLSDIEFSVLIASVGGASSETRTTLVAAGRAHALAIDSTGRLSARGNGTSGALGVNSTTDQNTPVPVSSTTTYSQVSAGIYDTYALDSTGHAWAWGWNNQGQLGDGTLTDRWAPTAVAGNRTYTQISAGYYHAVALDSTGHIWAWGADTYGQLGNDAAMAGKLVPVAVDPGRTYKSVSAGSVNSYAIDSSDHLWSWGEMAALGTNASVSQPLPVPVDATRTYKSVTGGHQAALAIDSSDHLRSWGSNNYGELGVGTVPSIVRLPTAVDTSRTYRQVSAGAFYTVALDSSGHIWTLGLDSNGQLGNDLPAVNSWVPVPVDAARTYSFVETGYDRAYAIDSTGSVWSWGAAQTSQIGQSNLPTSVAGW